MTKTKDTRLNKEFHPLWYRDVPVMKYLILGSFPPHFSKWDYAFYYPNSQNRFWYLLAEIAGTKIKFTKNEPENAAEERYHLMKKLCAGVQNLGYEITRKGTSARDSDIAILQFQDILSIVQQHPELEYILLPGFAAKSGTAQLFVRYLNEHHLLSHQPAFKAGNSFSFDFEGRTIQCFILNSTSTAARIPYRRVLEQFEKIFNLLG